MPVQAGSPEAFRIYRLFDFALVFQAFQLRPPLGAGVTLETATWMASFR